jgi:hypothetical protein
MLMKLMYISGLDDSVYTHAIKVDLWIYTSGNMVAFAKTERLMIFSVTTL